MMLCLRAEEKALEFFMQVKLDISKLNRKDQRCLVHRQNTDLALFVRKIFT